MTHRGGGETQFVEVVGPYGAVARGLIAYDAAEATVIAGRRNDERDPMELAKRLQAAHGEIVRLLSTPANRARLGVHGEWGEIDAAHVAAYQSRHAHEHVSDVAMRFPPNS